MVRNKIISELAKSKLRDGGRIGDALRNRISQLRDREASQVTAAPFIPTTSNLTQRPRSKLEMSQKFLWKRGQEIAESAKWMSDIEWEAASTGDKRAFTHFMNLQIKRAPAELTEQQRRRYYEQTLADPLKENPNQTVTETYQRLKMGLPVDVNADASHLGVTQAMYETGDANLFDPENVNNLENAMTHVKQKFSDYIRKKREGLATENERRELANMSSDLNYETQKHLANMFKFAEVRVQEMLKEKYRKQLMQIGRVRRFLKAEGKQAPAATAADQTREGQSKKRKRMNAQRWKNSRTEQILSESYGLDIETVRTICKTMKTQEEFLQLCEVITRLTLKRGFSHSREDQNLDHYMQTLQRIYAMEPGELAKVDVVQYVAAMEGSSSPLDWAKHWYESALMLPLQSTYEYQQLERMKEEEAGANEQKNDADVALEGEGEKEAEGSFAAKKQKQVVRLVEKMFLHPEDERLQETHEKRLRYIAYLQMESQISRMRKNAKLFEGAEDTKEGCQCQELYEKILNRRKELAGEEEGRKEGEESEGYVPPSPQRDQKYFQDAQIQSWYQEIYSIAKNFVKDVIQETASQRKAKKAAKILNAAVHSSGALENEIQSLKEKAKKEQVERMLRILEKDVREDMLWVENLQEAERPPLLPIPEPMSYVSAADVLEWTTVRREKEEQRGNPFKKKSAFEPKFLGQAWHVPSKPILFWGTGTQAVEQALKQAAEEAASNRTLQHEELAPPYPCAANPWGWRLKKDILDDDE